MSSLNITTESAVRRSSLLPSERDTGGRQPVYLHPGHLHVGTQSYPAAINCMLGSCVEVCLWDRKLKIGGAVHYMLPGDQGNPGPNTGFQGIRDLVFAILNAGANQSNMVAKVFGGSCMLPELRHSHIGDRNVRAAYSCLKDLRIAIINEDVGGERGRKVTFFTDTGEIGLRLV